MLYSDIIRRSGRNLRQAKARTILTALAIAVGTFALTLTLAASNGAQAFVDKIIKDNFDPSELIVTKDERAFGRGDTAKPQEYDESFGSFSDNSNATSQIRRLTEEDIDEISNMKGVEQVREGITLNLQYITRDGQKKYVATAQAFNPAQNPDLLAGSIPKPLGGNNLLLPEAYVSALGFKDVQEAIGKKLTVSVRKSFDQTKLIDMLQQGVPISPDQVKQIAAQSSQQEKFTIAAIMKKPTTSQPGTELYLFMGNDDAKRLNDYATKGTDNYHKYVYAYVSVIDGENEANLKVVQDDLIAKGYTAQSVQDTEKFLSQIISVLRGIVVAFGAIAVVASVFGVVNTMYISVLQRTREIGLMKALGMRRRDIGRLFRFEAAWIGFLGGFIGSLLAVIVGFILNPWITDKLELGDGNRLLIFNIPQILALIIILMVIAIIAGLLPARKAAKLDPIEALRTE